ncbi:MAG: DUF1080 domain-containing protein [Planctomycetota bacterium]|nr:DUF1080 domain-containing protein [Planctomycetota bacterium]
MRNVVLILLNVSILVIALGSAPFSRDEYKSGIVWPEPVAVKPGTPSTAPSDAIVLFDGTHLDGWKNGDAWKVENGYAEVRGTSIQTKQAFGDCQLHLEFATPAEIRGSGQGRGNSGVYLMGKYEVQILDSYENPTYFDGQCGALYKQQPPMVNASREPGEWQSFDILFTAPRFDTKGELEQPAYVTVLHNGVLIHNHYELPGGTFWDQPPHYQPHDEKLPITLQNHGNPLRFRNIWIRENIDPIVGKKPEANQ